MLNFFQDLFARKPIIRREAIINSARKSIATFREPGARTRSLKLELGIATRPQIRQNSVSPAAAFIRPDAFRPAENRNP